MDRDNPVETTRPGWLSRLPFSWVGLVGVSCLIYELTHSPALGVILVCLKFGWDDFLTARWLIRRDPMRSRGWATGGLFFSWGLWKTAVVAFLMSLVFAVISRRKPPMPGAPPFNPQGLMVFASTFSTSIVCFLLAIGMMIPASFTARRQRFRFWLHRDVHKARRADAWPPSPFCVRGPNGIEPLLLTTAFGVVLGLLLNVLLLLLMVGRFIDNNNIAGMFSIIMLLALPVFILVFKDFLKRGVEARHAWECWHDEELFPPAANA